MGDVGDYWNDHKEHARNQRRKAAVRRERQRLAPGLTELPEGTEVNVKKYQRSELHANGEPVYLASDVEAKLSAIRTLALAIRPTQWSHETEQIIRLIDEVLA